MNNIPKESLLEVLQEYADVGTINSLSITREEAKFILDTIEEAFESGFDAGVKYTATSVNNAYLAGIGINPDEIE